jgi:hypothetical protein
MRFVKTLVLGITLAAAARGLYAQAKPASGTGTNPATPAAKPAPQAAQPAAKPGAQAPAKPAAAPASAAQNKPAAAATNKPAASGAKPAAPKARTKGSRQAAKPSKPAAKPAPKRAAKKSTPRAAKPAASSTPAADREVRVAKRDPFESLVGREHAGTTRDLPQGKGGLQVSTLRLDGVVRAPNGMIAVVSNPQSRTYFLREGDQLYDGRVEKIAMDGVSFHEVGKDAFGKPVERQVNKRIYASAGEQQ